MVDDYEKILSENEFLDLNRVILRRFRIDDTSDVLEYGSDKETLKFLVWTGVFTEEEARLSINEYYLAKPGVYAIELKENKKCIGTIDLRLEPDHEKASFGYVLNRKFWGKGYMTEALGGILKLCFEKLNLNRVESTHYVGNEGSGKVMEKCGMKREGVGIEEVKVKGVFYDVVHYGITKLSL